jgi:hypothetical protein
MWEKTGQKPPLKLALLPDHLEAVVQTSAEFDNYLSDVQGWTTKIRPKWRRFAATVGKIKGSKRLRARNIAPKERKGQVLNVGVASLH